MNRKFFCYIPYVIIVILIVWIIARTPCPSPNDKDGGDALPPPGRVRFLNKTKKPVKIKADDIELEMEYEDSAGNKHPNILTSPIQGAPIQLTPVGGMHDSQWANLNQGDPAMWGITHRIQATIRIEGVGHEFHLEVHSDLAQDEDFKHDFLVIMSEMPKTEGGQPGVEYSVELMCPYDGAGGADTKTDKKSFFLAD